MAKNSALGRLSQCAGAIALMSVLVACGGSNSGSTSGVNDQSSSSNDLSTTALPNRFADLAYPDASAHKWAGPEDIYNKVCGYCHAPKPLGGVGPIILGRQLPPVYTIYTVRNGRNGMPGFPETDFSNEELAALADWIQASEAPAAMPMPPMPAPPKGHP